MKDQYDEWIEEVAFRYDELLIKMTELSKKCFSVKVDPEKYKMGIEPGNFFVNLSVLIYLFF